MNWYRVKLNDTRGASRRVVGCSADSAEAIAEKAARGEYIRLDQLLYAEQGEVKDFAEWDSRLLPTMYINPKNISYIMQFTGDPRDLPMRGERRSWPSRFKAWLSKNS